MTEDEPAAPAKKGWSLERALSLSGQIVGLFAVVGTIVFAIKVLIVSGFNLSVALALIVNSSLATLILTVTLTGIGLVAISAPAIFLALYLRFSKRWPKKYTLPGFLTLVAASAALCGLFVDTLFAFVLGGLVVFIGLLLTEVTPKLRLVELFLVPVLWFLLLILPLTMVFSPEMWLPPERAHIDGIPKKIYVLDHSSGEYVFFDPEDRSVRRVAEGSLTGRQYCLVRPKIETRSLADMIFGRPKGLPDCP